MNKNVLDPYGDLVDTKFYLDKFDVIPSLLNLELSFVNTAENIKEVIQIIKKNVDFEVITERWKVSKYKGDLKSKDFIDYYFILIPKKLVCIQIEILDDAIEIKYCYNQKELLSTNWVLESYKEIRNVFGDKLSPTFRVLAKNRDEFYVEEIRIQQSKIDIESSYNNDFKEIDLIINNSLKLDKSGLILLHGKPGTGKTTYIKNLLSIHRDKKFIFVPNDFINELIQPAFISFLVSHKNSILVIEDAEKVITSRERVNNNSVVSTILQLTDGLFSDYLNIKILCTFNTNINNIDKALLRKGRMIAFYEFKELSVEKTNLLLSSLNQRNSEKELTVAEIYYSTSLNFQQQEKKIGFNNDQ